MQLLEEIKKLGIEAEADEDTLSKYSHDASLFEIRPQTVVYPKSAEDIRQLVNFVNLKKQQGVPLSLTARAGGTDMTGAPLTESIVVDFTRYMNHVTAGEGYAVTEPGVFYRDFEKRTLEKGWLLPSYPASREICALGGMIANNSGGEKTLAYGKTEKYVEELSVVLSDGNVHTFRPLAKEQLLEKMVPRSFVGRIYREMFELIDKNYDLLQKAKPKVSKNSSGYLLWNVYDKKRGIFDLTKLFVGSQGTLGMITEARLNLVRPKKAERLLVVFLRDMAKLDKAAQTILNFAPESFESYDDHTFKLALKFLPAMAKQLKGNMLSLGISFLPELFMVVTGGIPKLVLMAEFTGETGEEATLKAEKAEKALRPLRLKTKVVHTEDEMKKYWTVRRESFNLLRNHVHGMRTAPFIDDFVIRPEQLTEFLPKLYAVLDRYNLIYTIAGHVGDANFHIIPLMDFSKPETKEVIEKLAHEVYDLVFSFGGSMSAEHNDGLIRTPFLEKMYGKEVCELFRQTKEIFDPHGIFNPGKKVGANLSYALEHLVKNS